MFLKYSKKIKMFVPSDLAFKSKILLYNIRLFETFIGKFNKNFKIILYIVAIFNYIYTFK